MEKKLVTETEVDANPTDAEATNTKENRLMFNDKDQSSSEMLMHEAYAMLEATSQADDDVILGLCYRLLKLAVHKRLKLDILSSVKYPGIDNGEATNLCFIARTVYEKNFNEWTAFDEMIIRLEDDETILEAAKSCALSFLTVDLTSSWESSFIELADRDTFPLHHIVNDFLGHFPEVVELRDRGYQIIKAEREKEHAERRARSTLRPGDDEVETKVVFIEDKEHIIRRLDCGRDGHAQFMICTSMVFWSSEFSLFPGKRVEIWANGNFVMSSDWKGTVLK